MFLSFTHNLNKFKKNKSKKREKTREIKKATSIFILQSLSLFCRSFCCLFWPLFQMQRPIRLMKMLVTTLFIVLFSNVVKADILNGEWLCDNKPTLELRPHSVSILEFGATGDGKTLNTLAFQNAIFYLKSFADKGGAQLYVPPGQWLTGSFNLTSHLTLFLAKGAIILASQDVSHWEVVDPLPSYGRGRELPGKRYRSLINGYMLEDVVITGDNGTIDGQGSIWWDWYNSGSLNYSRPHLFEIISSKDIIVSNLTFINAPAISVRPVYCSNVHIRNISVYTPPESPYTIGIVPDSADELCIHNCSIATGHDAISLKSGWDEYGISYAMPTTNIHIKQVSLQSHSGSALSFGTEMSGGIAHVFAEQIFIRDSNYGIDFKTAKGRGGYIESIIVSDVKMENVGTAFGATGQSGAHPDEGYDPEALPEVSRITFKNVIGENITLAGSFSGIEESPFTLICLSDISLAVNNNNSSSSYWVCENVSGSSKDVSPEPCPELKNNSAMLSSSCFSLGGRAAAL